MTTRFFPIFATTLVALAAPAHARQQDPAVRLERARYEANVRGNVQEAIRILQDVVRNHGGRRELAARALIDLGQAYEALGRSEARASYQRVLAEFADQRGAADVARARLAALTGDAQPVGAGTAGLSLRKVWQSREGFSSLSPDGRYVAFQDWGTIRDPATRGHADVALYDTGEQKIRLVTNRPSLALVDVYPTAPFTWSPDGQWIAYGLHAVGWTHRELHVVRPDGRDDRKVLDNRQMADVRAWGFSSDNRFIVAALKGWDNVWRIGVVTLQDSSLAILKTLGTHQVERLALSPDNRYIAYEYPENDSTPAHDIRVMAVDGSAEVTVAPHRGDDVSGNWTPRGDMIVFDSDRAGQRAVWAIRWANGRADGEPEMVYQHLGSMRLRGVTSAGGLYFSADGGGSEVFQASLDVASDSAPRHVTRLPESNLLTNLRPAWSPQGERIAWLSQRGLAGEPLHLVVKVLATGVERSHALPFVAGDFRAIRPEWSADGRTISLQARDEAARVRRSYEVNMETGTVTREDYLRDFAGMAGAAVTEFFFADDRQSRALRSLGIRLLGQTDNDLIRSGDIRLRPGETAYRARNGVFRVRSLAAMAAATTDSARWAAEDALVPYGAMDSWRLSPDGTRIALAISSDTVMESNVLRVVSLADGRARELDRVERSGGVPARYGVIAGVRWAPDGRHVLYAIRRTGLKSGESFTTTAEVWMVNPDLGAPRRLDLTMTPYELSNMSFHPDGRRIAYTVWKDRVGEVWVAGGLPWQAESRR